MHRWSRSSSPGGARGNRARGADTLSGSTPYASACPAPSTTSSSFGSPAASYSRSPWRQLMSWSSFGAMTSSARGANRATYRIAPGRRDRVRTAAAATMAREPSRAAGSRPRACGCRSGGAARRRPSPRRPPRPAGQARRRWRWRRPCSPRTARSVRARASAGSRPRRPRRVARATRASPSQARSLRAPGSRTGGRGGARGATARRQPARESVAGEAVEDDDRGACLACGRHQPPRQGDAVIGREADRLVLETDVGGSCGSLPARARTDAPRG